MILSRKAIKTALEKGALKLAPFSDAQIGPAHIDLHLGGLTPSSDIVIPAHGFRTAKTLEVVTLSEELCGFIQGRTSLAKYGISVEQSSTFIEPGSDDHMLLEIFNASDTPYRLKPGQLIAKMTLTKVTDTF